MYKRSWPRPLISVIIPTYNRAQYLQYSLASLMRQSIPEKLFEVIVIDDGSLDDTLGVCKRFQSSLRLKYHRQENSGIATAKNLGIFVAEGEILLFFDDDDFAHEDFVLNHLKAHQKWPNEEIAVLGFTTWFPGMRVTPLMHYVTEVGCFLFSYGNLKPGQILDFTYFWGGRSSSKRSFLVRHGIFNQDFMFGSEDIELGYRLSKLGLKVLYDPDCVSYMRRPITYDEFCARCERQGRSQYLFSRLHPDPVIQDYCTVESARREFGFIRDHLEERMSKVRELESLLCADASACEQDGPLCRELFELYGWTFDTIKKIEFVKAERSFECIDSGSDLEPGSAGETNKGARVGLWGLGARGSLPATADGCGDSTFKRQVLFIDAETPTPDKDSGSGDIYEFMKIFRSLSFRVTFIPAFDFAYKEGYTEKLQRCGIECIHKPQFQSVEAFLQREGHRFDLVMIYRAPVASQYFGVVRRLAPQARIVFDTVDLYFLRAMREADLLGSAQAREDAVKLRSAELDIISQADRTIVLSKTEKKLISELLPDAKVDLIPIVRPIPGRLAPFDGRNHVVFIGGFWHTPNRDAICWFSNEVWPLIAPRLPGSRLFIVGSNLSEDISALASDTVVILGYVPELAKIFANCRLTIAPLRYGAGIKGKIVTSLSYGVPCVATGMACEGMGLIPGEHVLIADDPADFAEAVVRLHCDKALWNRLSEAGLAFARENYSVERIALLLRDMLGKLNLQPVADKRAQERWGQGNRMRIP